MRGFYFCFTSNIEDTREKKGGKNLWHRLSGDRSIFSDLTDGIPEIPGRCLNGRFVPTSDPLAQLLNNDVCLLVYSIGVSYTPKNMRSTSPFDD